MKLPSNSISSAEAKRLGYRPLTVDYLPSTEREALDNVQRDLDKDRIDFVLVRSNQSMGISVWRKGMILETTGAVKIPHDPR